MKKTFFCTIAILFAVHIQAQLKPQPQPSQNVDAWDAAGSFALHFDGVKQWLSLEYWDMGDLTLESWVKLDSSGSGGPFLNRQEDLMMGVSNGKAYIQLELGGANWQILYSTQTLVPGIWYHVAGTYDHSAMRIYINGQLDSELAATGTLFHDGCTGYWSIGAAYDECSNRYFSLFAGTVDEIRVWDYARNQSEIQSTLYTSLTGHESGLVGYWPLDEGSGQIAKDQSLHGRDGTLGSGNQIDINDPVWVNSRSPQNTTYGTNALNSNSSGLYNSAFGFYSLFKNTTGNNNSAFGYHSLYSNTKGNSNMAFGSQALYSNTIGIENTALGTFALLKNKSGSQNTASGTKALYANTTGNYNTSSGVSALTSNTTGISNTASGFSVLSSNTTGSSNTATGYFALIANITGLGNTAAGWSALSNNTTGKYNTALGNNANTSIGNLTNSTSLGRGSLITASNQVRIGNTNVTSIGGYTNWSNISDGRYKKNLKENVPGLQFINALRPVTYNLKVTELDGFLRRDMRITGKTNKSLEMDKKATDEKEKIIYTGFVAQEVEKAAKEIGYDFSGVDAPKNDHDVYALRYAEFVVPLVKAIQELSQKNDRLKNEIATIKSMRQQTQNDAVVPYSSPTNEDEKLSVTASSNPVKSLLHISIKDNYISPVIKVFDMYDRIIFLKRVTQTQTELDVGKLTAGIYSIKITDAEGKQLYNGKFIKQN